jgi:hypothetical protein
MTVGVTIPSVSTEYARVKISSDVSLGTQPVYLAFLTSSAAEPASGDWQTATWLGTADTTRYAGVLVGPGALVLAEGVYWCWFKVTDSPEVPARNAGRLTIT